MPSAEAPTIGRVISKVASAFGGAALLARAGALELLVELVHAAEQVLDRDAAVLEDDLGGLRGADAELRLLLALRRPGVPLATTKEAWPRWPSSGSTVATTTVTSAMPPLVMKTLVPLSTHSSPSSLAVVRRLLTSEPRLRLGHGVGAELDLVADAEALGHPLGDLLGGARGGDAGGGEAGALDGERDAGAAPVELLGVDHAELPVRVGCPCAGCARCPCRPHSRASLMTSQGVLSSRSCWRRRAG